MEFNVGEFSQLLKKERNAAFLHLVYVVSACREVVPPILVRERRTGLRVCDISREELAVYAAP